jgi:isopentenyl-diphosphate delta-isomerase
LGADVVGSARPVLKAFMSDGRAGVDRFLATMKRGLKMAMLLTGSRTPKDLRAAPRVVGPRLQSWLDQVGR